MAFLSNRLSAVLLTSALVTSLACTRGSDGKWEPGPSPEPTAAAPDETADDAEARATGWKKANLTNFESYPDPDSEECREYNGCTWAGQFAFVDGKKSENWVRNHNIAAVHSKDRNKYKLKTLRLKKGGDQIDVKVYDYCSDSDCDGCCTENANEHGYKFLVDIEKYTMQRFGHGDGTVQFKCLDCD